MQGISRANNFFLSDCTWWWWQISIGRLNRIMIPTKKKHV